MAKWMNAFIETFTSANNGREPTKNEIKAATPLFLNIDYNPKGKNTQSFTRFEGYFEGGRTIGEVMKDGVRQDDIRHDSAHRFILLGDDAVAAYEAQALAEMEMKQLESVDGEFEVVEPAPVLAIEGPKKPGRKAK